MWLTEEFAEGHAQGNDSANKNIPENPLTPTPPEQQQIHIWDFRINPVLIGNFNGAGIEIGAAGSDKKIGTWMIQIEPGKIFHVPQWPAFDVPAGNFLGFSKEIPSDGSMYMIQYFGIDEQSKSVSLKIFKK